MNYIYKALLCLLLPLTACAQKLPLPPKGDDLVGSLTSTVIHSNDTIASIARKNDIGFFAILEANPQLDPKHLLPGTEIIIPKQFLLPQVPHKGIVINLSSMRLFYFPQGQKYFYSYPIGIGKKDWNTPVGKLKIVEKIENPKWHVPKSIYEYRKENGDPVPHVVPSGPKNPLGYFAMRLSLPTYLIHGTNDPASVGVRSSAGCIHLYPEDIKQLFSLIKVGTPVLILNSPYIAGYHNEKLYIEAHLPLQEDRLRLSHVLVDTSNLALSVGKTLKQINKLDAFSIIHFHTGIPTELDDPS